MALNTEFSKRIDNVQSQIKELRKWLIIDIALTCAILGEKAIEIFSLV